MQEMKCWRIDGAVVSCGTMEVVSRSQKGWWAWPVGAMVVCLGVLFVWQPYAQGYGDKAISVGESLVWMWQNVPEWEHGALVPLICAGLIYWRRERLVGLEVRGSTGLGLALLMGSLLFYWIGFRIDITGLGFLSIQLVLGSLIVWFLGWRWFVALLFPWAFLIFAWPLPYLDNLAFFLRMVMTAISYFFLNLIGVDVIRSGTAIISAADYARGIPAGAKFQLDVADPCSGIRSLFALMMVTALYAHVMLRKVWQQWALFLCAVPLAVLGNFGRIIMLTFGTMAFGSEFAIGSEEDPSTFHMASGFAVFAIALGGMALIGWLLEAENRAELVGKVKAFFKKDSADKRVEERGNA
jgi:exosortase